MSIFKGQDCSLYFRKSEKKILLFWLFQVVATTILEKKNRKPLLFSGIPWDFHRQCFITHLHRSNFLRRFLTWQERLLLLRKIPMNGISILKNFISADSVRADTFAQALAVSGTLLFCKILPSTVKFYCQSKSVQTRYAFAIR